MNRILAKISKGILFKQEAHVISFKHYQLQKRLDEAFKNDDSHTRNLSE